MASQVLDHPAKVTGKKLEAGTVHWFNECVERGKCEVFSETTLLTPGLAGELLLRNPDNRGVRPKRAERIANDIRAGRWSFNGEPIIVSKVGLLNDGQHRAQAIVDANRPVPVVMVFGVERDTRTTVDQGAARTASDYLSMQGVEHAAIRASVARMAIALERSNNESFSGAGEVTNAEAVARAIRDDEIAYAAHYVSRHGRRMAPFAAPSIIAIALYKFRQVDEAEADAFVEKVCTGEGLKLNEAAHTLREKLLTEGKSRDRKVALFFRAWNFYRRNMKVRAGSLNSTLPLPALI